MALRNFKPDTRGFQQIGVSPEMRAALKQVAEHGREIAEELAADFAVTGDYEKSFEVTDETVEWNGEYPGPRAAAQLTNTSDHAASVEWGNEHAHKNHRVLGRTLDALNNEP